MATSLETRLRFIELLAYWEGQIKTPQVAEQFGLSDNQARAAIAEYEQSAPQNLIYDKSQKAKIATEKFKPLFIDQKVDEYLRWLQTGSAVGDAKQFVESLAKPERTISPDVMRGLVTAVKQRRRVDVEYASLSNPLGEGRVLSPHSFINTGSRWHVRAYCGKAQEFRDFVLSRFRGKSEVMDAATNTIDQDTLWNTPVNVRLQPDPRLSEQKRKVIEEDYQMVGGVLDITVRACLVNYFLREMQISTKSLELLPEAQQLICSNLGEIKRWLFEG